MGKNSAIDMNANHTKKNGNKKVPVKKTKKNDIENLKKEFQMDEHQITLQELCSRLHTDVDNVSFYKFSYIFIYFI